MRAYKAFNAKLQATMGRGIFQFAPGETYEEPECKCATNGFHCAENPLCAMDYYPGTDSRFFVVEAGGEINQDGFGSRISCTRITLVKEITRIQLAAHACLYIQRYPERDMESRHAKRDKGTCWQKGDFLIVRGKSPMAAGKKGTYLFLIQEYKNSSRIKGICPVYIDGDEYLPDTWYALQKGEICEKKNSDS